MHFGKFGYLTVLAVKAIKAKINAVVLKHLEKGSVNLAPLDIIPFSHTSFTMAYHDCKLRHLMLTKYVSCTLKLSVAT